MSTRPDLDAFAHGPLDDDDVSLILRLRELLDQVDPVPADLAARAQFAMTVTALEADVARMVSTDELAAMTRSIDYERATSVTFVSDGLSVMLTLELVGPNSAHVRGWLTAPGAEVELRERARTRQTTADAAGRFAFEGVSRGLVHLVIHPADPGLKPVITPAFEM